MIITVVLLFLFEGFCGLRAYFEFGGVWRHFSGLNEKTAWVSVYIGVCVECTDLNGSVAFVLNGFDALDWDSEIILD